MSSAALARDAWPDVVAAFQECFGGIGDVTATKDAVTFSSAATGLELRRDGTSRSFMPLHELGARWETVHFDAAAGIVQLEGGGVSYTYRIPPGLMDSR